MSYIDNCTGFGGYLSPTCYIEGWTAAVTRGLGKGTGEGLNKVIDNVVDKTAKKFQDINFDGAGENLAKFLNREGRKLYETTNGINLEGTGERVGKFLNREGQNFFKSANIDTNSAAAKIGKVFNEGQKAFLHDLNTAEMGRNIGKSVEDAWEGLDLGSQGQTIGNSFKEFMASASLEIGEGAQEALRNTLTGVRNEYIFNQLPYFLGAAAVTTTVALGTPLALRYLYAKAVHNIGRPKLATDVKQMSLFKSLTSPLSKLTSAFKAKVVKPTYDNKTTRLFNQISKAIQNIRKNNGYFQNVLLYGPGGTGKTMGGQLLAELSGMSYVKMSGGDLAQYIKRGEHVSELNKLFDKLEASWRPWSTRPWILFVDEAESLCKDRSKITSAELLELENAFLSRTGTQNKKFALVMATNRLEDLDPAVLNRMDYKIFIGPPALAERTQIIKDYLPQFFTAKERTNLFDDGVVNDIAAKTEGFTGRSIFKLLNAIANHRAMTQTNALTKEIVMQTVADFVLQEQEVKQMKTATKN